MMVQAAYKSADIHTDVICKREETIKSDVKLWLETTIEALKTTERKRFWIVFEEIRRYREQTTLYINTLSGCQPVESNQ